MFLTKAKQDDMSLGIRIYLHVSEDNSFTCREEKHDLYRKSVYIGLPKQSPDHWLSGIVQILSALRLNCIYCAISIDYTNWCKFFRPQSLRLLEDQLPVTICLRVFGVPRKSQVMKDPEPICAFVQQLFLAKKRQRRLEKKGCS